MYRTFSSAGAVILICAEAPGRTRGSPATSKVTSNFFVESLAHHIWRDATPLTVRTDPCSFASGSVSTASSIGSPADTLARSCSLTRALTSMLDVSITSMSVRPDPTLSPTR